MESYLTSALVPKKIMTRAAIRLKFILWVIQNQVNRGWKGLQKIRSSFVVVYVKRMQTKSNKLLAYVSA